MKQKENLKEIKEEIKELSQEKLEQAAGGFPFVPTVPVAPIDEELREDV